MKNFFRWILLLWNTLLVQFGISKPRPLSEVCRHDELDSRTLRLRLDVMRAVQRGATTVPSVVAEVRGQWPECFTSRIAQVTWELLDQGIIRRDERGHLELVL
jgi:hypothetical protein